MTTDTLFTAVPDELERLRAENARLIHDIQAPDGYPWEWHCTRKDEELAKLRHALGLLTTLKPDMEIDVLDPLDMAQQIVEYVNAETERLRQEKAEILAAKEIVFAPPAIPEGFVIQELQKANVALHADIARLRSGARCPHCDELRLDLGDARREIERLRELLREALDPYMAATVNWRTGWTDRVREALGE